MREKILNQEPPCTNRVLRPPLKPAKIRASRKPKQLQAKRQKIPRQKGSSIPCYHGYHLWSEGKLTPIDAGKTSHKAGAQGYTQSINQPRNKSIKNWISACAQMADREDLLQSPSENIPPPSAREFILRHERCSTNALAITNRASWVVGSSKYRELLGKYNIHITDGDPPPKVVEAAMEIISPPKSSFEMDDATAGELRLKLQSLVSKNEDVFVRQMGPRLFPAMDNVPDPTLGAETNDLWDQTVSIPLDPVPLQIPAPLRRPRPDLVFGYSEAAFDTNQLMAIEHLVGEPNQNYAKPVKTLGFPFLQIEFKSCSTGGDLYAAENQVASAGAIAMNGLLELYRRIPEEADLDIDKPQYFSLAISQRYVSVNVHWLDHSAKNNSVCFNMGPISHYGMTDLEGVKKVHQTVKNILDYGFRKRLPEIRTALDIYKQKVVLERESLERERAIRSRHSSPEPQAEEPKTQKRQLGNPSVDQRPARRRRLGRPALKEQQQSRRATRARAKNARTSTRCKKKLDQTASSANPARASSIAESARSHPRGDHA